MTDLVNEFSWSKSRDNMFNTCKRKYYLHYYGSWGGWEWDASPEVRKLYIMKNLSSIPMWVGSAVHEVLKWVNTRNLKMGENHVSFIEAKDKLNSDMVHSWNSSLNARYRQNPRKNFWLVEHYYNEPIGDLEFEDAYSLAEICLENFFLHSIYNQLAEMPSVRILAIEELDKFLFEETLVWAMCDLVLSHNVETWIVDWKTGRKVDETYDLQLAVYALYAMNKGWCFDPDRIKLHQAYLFLNEGKDDCASGEVINEASDYIRASVAEMKSYLVDPEHNFAIEADFPMVDNLGICRYCNFRKACGRIN